MAHTNRLASEKSPYLLQHAHNPVNWYPWGSEAFEKARSEAKPIFLSIGYSTCHWCHVMERESFENEEVAAVLNRKFVPIKVDREERPDVDAIYMAATQAMTGSGGWPMSVFLTPDLKPFYAGTYFPPQSAYGRPSFMQLIEKIAELWQTKRASLLESAEHLTNAIREGDAEKSDVIASHDALLLTTFLYFERTFDEELGGFGGAPKFPRPVQFDFLFQYWYARGRETAKDMALVTLRRMALGGLHDHLGGGFHRYSVDRFWRVSHFEKMLYDQAQLVQSYLDAYQITNDSFFADVVLDTAGYVLRDMTHPDGGFYSAEDADSEGEEGKFYAWTEDDVRSVLGNASPLFFYFYGFTPNGNFEHGKNVLHISHSLEETANEFGLTEQQVLDSLADSRAKLFAVRSARVRPHLDDKVLTSWNGLMIGALARAGDVLESPECLQAALRAAEFIWKELRPHGHLLHRWRDGEARFDAYLESYAFLISGFLDLYMASADHVWIERAIELQKEQDEVLWDSENGGYWLARESSDVLVRTKGEYDGAEPSGNSVAALNLLRLAQFTANTDYRDKAERILAYFLPRVQKFPYAMPELLTSLFWFDRPGPMEIVFAGAETEPLERVVSKRYLPITVRMRVSDAANDFARSLSPVQGKATCYVCHNFACELPATSVDMLAHELDRTSASAPASTNQRPG